jgi:hypothetical protein
VSNENFAIFPKPTSASFFCATACGGGTASATTYPSDGNSMDIVEGYICNPSTPTSLTAGNEHDFAVTYRIETSGGTGAASSTANNACTPGS